VRRVVWPLIRDDENVQLLSTSNGQSSCNQPSMLYGQVCSPESQKYDRPSLSSDVIGKELCADRLSKTVLSWLLSRAWISLRMRS
jgi:hypothetical protein